MSIFNQNDNLKHCPITASVIHDIIEEDKDNFPACPITEQQFEERVSDILYYMYYSIKSGIRIGDLVWMFPLSIFGITESSTEYTYIKVYLWNRFKEAGFEVCINLTSILISIPYGNKSAWLKSQKVFTQTITSDLGTVMPIPSTPLMITPFY